MSSRTKILLKTAFSLSLLGFLAFNMDLGEFGRELSSVHLGLLFLAVMVQSTTIFMSVSRWRAILANFDIRTTFLNLVKITYIGNFFNLFLPSAIGGDFFRAYYLSKREKRGMSTTLTTTVLERSGGLFALLCIGGFFASLHRLEVQGVSLAWLFILLILLYVLANVAIFHSWLRDWLTGWLVRKGRLDIESKMALVGRGLESLRKNGRAMVVVVSVSFVIQFFSVVIMWIAARSMGIDASFYVFLIFIPIVNLTIMIPLTINGFGLRESVYALLFAQIGYSTEQAVTLSLLNFAVVALASLPGALVYSFYKKDEHFGELLAEAQSRSTS